MLGSNCKVAPFIKGAAPTCNCKLECPFIKGAAPTVKVYLAPFIMEQLAPFIKGAAPT